MKKLYYGYIRVTESFFGGEERFRLHQFSLGQTLLLLLRYSLKISPALGGSTALFSFFVLLTSYLLTLSGSVIIVTIICLGCHLHTLLPATLWSLHSVWPPEPIAIQDYAILLLNALPWNLKAFAFKSQKKAFATCASHLTVIIIHYGCASIIYLKPKSQSSLGQDRLNSVTYTVLTPWWTLSCST
eukprot:bmy_20815T0